jgi:hypothetical protein
VAATTFRLLIGNLWRLLSDCHIEYVQGCDLLRGYFRCVWARWDLELALCVVALHELHTLRVRSTDEAAAVAAVSCLHHAAGRSSSSWTGALTSPTTSTATRRPQRS